MASSSLSLDTGGLLGHGTLCLLPDSSCQVGSAWGRRENGQARFAALCMQRPAGAAGSATSLPLCHPDYEALLCSTHGLPGSATDTTVAPSLPSRLAPAQRSPGSAGHASCLSLQFLAGLGFFLRSISLRSRGALSAPQDQHCKGSGPQDLKTGLPTYWCTVQTLAFPDRSSPCPMQASGFNISN